MAETPEEFTYDAHSRRVGKGVYSTIGGNPIVETAYLYDGWNLVAELIHNPQSEILNSYVWGLDLSGTLQGAGLPAIAQRATAGGVGGLLSSSLQSPASSLLPCYDANGNVMALVDTADGSLAATYEYDPFGNTLRATGTKAAANPFRFSTMCTDDETGIGLNAGGQMDPQLDKSVACIRMKGGGCRFHLEGKFGISFPKLIVVAVGVERGTGAGREVRTQRTVDRTLRHEELHFRRFVAGFEPWKQRMAGLAGQVWQAESVSDASQACKTALSEFFVAFTPAWDRVLREEAVHGDEMEGSEAQKAWAEFYNDPRNADKAGEW